MKAEYRVPTPDRAVSPARVASRRRRSTETGQCTGGQERFFDNQFDPFANLTVSREGSGIDARDECPYAVKLTLGGSSSKKFIFEKFIG